MKWKGALTIVLAGTSNNNNNNNLVEVGRLEALRGSQVGGHSPKGESKCEMFIN